MQPHVGDADAAVQRYLGEDALAEILLRLPSKSIGRFRAVCKDWRRITTDPTFVSDHYERRPPEKLMYAYLKGAVKHPDPDAGAALGTQHTAIDEAGRLRLVDLPQLGGRHMLEILLASCNGVLLFKADDGLYIICNPVTRQWAQLPRLAREYRTCHNRECAFYFHQPSNEYRLLCRRCTIVGVTYYILSIGSAEPRHMDMNAIEAGEAGPDPLSVIAYCYKTPVALHGRLHWPPCVVNPTGEAMVVAFDTVSETFHRVAPPGTTYKYMMELFKMDGMLAASELIHMHIGLWFLEDYDAGRWERRHRVALPWSIVVRSTNPILESVAAAGNDDEVNITLTGSRKNQHGLLVYSTRTRKIVKAVDLMNRLSDMMPSRHAFRESLVQHACFQAQPSTAGVPLVRFLRDPEATHRSTKWKFRCSVAGLVISPISDEFSVNPE